MLICPRRSRIRTSGLRSSSSVRSLALLFLVALSGVACESDPSNAETLLDLSKEIALLGEWPRHDSTVASHKLVELGDEAVPTLRKKLTELSARIEEIKADQRTDARGYPSYDHLDAEAAKQAQAEWPRINQQHAQIFRVLQKIGTPAARRALEEYFETRPPQPTPSETILNPTSKPVQLGTALELVLLCGQYDASTARLARTRMGVDEDRRVRALAAYLAVKSGLGQEALPVLLELAESSLHGPNSGGLFVLLALAHLKGPDELQTISSTPSFRSRDAELGIYAARFIHGDDTEKHAAIKEVKAARHLPGEYLDQLFLPELLGERRENWLRDFNYVQPVVRGGRAVPGEFKIPESSARLFSALRYSVDVDGDDIRIKRLSCL